jgi:hypothetical protein
MSLASGAAMPAVPTTGAWALPGCGSGGELSLLHPVTPVKAAMIATVSNNFLFFGLLVKFFIPRPPF